MFTGPNIVKDGLVLALDAGSHKSYPGSGTTWYDLSGNGNNSSFVNDTTFNSNSVELDGTDSYLSGNISSNTFSSEFSISCWFNRNSSGVWDALFSNNVESINWDNSTKEAAILGFRGAGGDTNFPNGTSVGINLVGTSASGVYLNLGNDHYNNWINLTLTRSGTTISIYAFKKGSLLTSFGSYSSTIQTYDRYLIGRHWYNSGNTSSQIFNGKISNISVYNKKLSANEVLQNYNATKTRFGL